MLGDAVDQLESDQAIDPSPTLEDAANTVRYVRDRLAMRQAARSRARRRDSVLKGMPPVGGGALQ